VSTVGTVADRHQRARNLPFGVTGANRNGPIGDGRDVRSFDQKGPAGWLRSCDPPATGFDVPSRGILTFNGRRRVSWSAPGKALRPEGPPLSIDLTVPKGISSFELALALLKALQRDLGAVVTNVDLGVRGGTIALSCRQLEPNGTGFLSNSPSPR
jgi:hypothetical protein